MTPGRKLMLLVERVSGIVLPDRELQRLTDWAERRAALKKFRDVNAYVEDLRRNRDSGEWRVVLSRVTVKESSLFRGTQQFTSLRESIIPELIETGQKTIRVWSAGCARGEEPATLAVVVKESLAGSTIQWSVLGTDVDDEALEMARRARFSRRAVRRVPKDSLERYFNARAGGFDLKANVLSHLQFDSINLIQDPLEVPGGPFDVIFLRNVLIYFNRERQIRVVENVQKNLAPGGFLMVGPSESLMGLAPNLQVEEREGVFVYRKCRNSATRDSLNQLLRHTPPGPESPEIETTQTNETANQAMDPRLFAIEGYQAETRGDLRTALRCYRASLYLQPNLYQIRYRLGCCLEKVGWSRRARAEFRAVLEFLEGGQRMTIEGLDGPDFPSGAEIVADCQKSALRSDEEGSSV